MIKSIYVTSFIMAANVGLIAALVMMYQGGWQTPWLGTAIACGASALFFTHLILMPRARTSPHLTFMIVAGVLGTAVSVYLGAALTSAPVLIAALVGIVDFEIIENGSVLKSTELTNKPALWIFYRGNWCPLCTAQIKEIAGQYRELARRGVEVFLVSPQAEENSVALSKKMGAPMRYLTDKNNVVAEKLGILVKGGLPAGFQALGYDSDVPRPTVFITATGGKLLHVDMTDNYRVRPEPATFFSVLDRHAIV